jgi:hypothetical protein
MHSETIVRQRLVIICNEKLGPIPLFSMVQKKCLLHSKKPSIFRPFPVRQRRFGTANEKWPDLKGYSRREFVGSGGSWGFCIMPAFIGNAWAFTRINDDNLAKPLPTSALAC